MISTMCEGIRHSWSHRGMLMETSRRALGGDVCISHFAFHKQGDYRKMCVKFVSLPCVVNINLLIMYLFKLRPARNCILRMASWRWAIP